MAAASPAAPGDVYREAALAVVRACHPGIEPDEFALVIGADDPWLRAIADRVWQLATEAAQVVEAVGTDDDR